MKVGTVKLNTTDTLFDPKEHRIDKHFAALVVQDRQGEGHAVLPGQDATDDVGALVAVKVIVSTSSRTSFGSS
jgi:hypothetical protein